MAPLPPRRRVSYVIPFPPSINPVPPLWLPPLGFDRDGSINPILIHTSEKRPSLDPGAYQGSIPRHRLGVSSLALDTTTQLISRPSPEGILYTGGRDGLVIAWDLNIPMKKHARKSDVARQSSTRWELITGWSDDIDDDTLDDDADMRSDGDILGDVKGSARRRKLSIAAATGGSIPFEHQWEPDVQALRPGQSSTFRQAAQIHSDWVNDILLCRQNQMLVSASSDGTVKAWNPHSSPLSDPVTVGTHADYVRCLAYSRDQAWVASGSFDRTVKLWDLSRASQAQTAQPITTLTPPESSGPKSSVYALAADPQGQMIVSGGPERVIRMWDPRAGKRIGKLVGHTDNIRAILVSEDSRCLLTASADASIKLWSLTSQRCLHTFTHHTDSVWALHSSHPSLEIFYSGDKSGFVARVDVEGCSQISEGECTLVCQDIAPRAEGITKLVALDDALVWTASGSSNVRRWRTPSRRAVRAAALIESSSSAALRTVSRLRPSRSTDSRPRSVTLEVPPSPPLQRQPRHSISMNIAFPSSPLEAPLPISLDDGTGEGQTTWYGLPYDCLVHLASPLSDPFTPFSPVYRGRGAGADADVATLYSAASLMSVSGRPPILHAPLRGIFPSPSPPSPTQSPASIGRPVSPARSDFAPSGSGLGSGMLGSGGGAGSGVGGAGGVLGRHRAAFESREVVADAQPLSPTPDFVLVGAPGLVRATLLSNRVHALTVDTAGTIAVWDIVRAACVGQFAQKEVLAANANSCGHHEEGEGVCNPREALDLVRERIDGEAVVVPWSYVDTSMGMLNVHLDEHAFDAELYADELGCSPERPLPAGLNPEDVRINLGKWVLENLFQKFIREEERAHARRLRNDGITHPQRSITSSPAPPPPPFSPKEPANGADAAADATCASSVVVVAHNMVPALMPNRTVGLGISHLPFPHVPAPTQAQLSQAVGSPTALGSSESKPQRAQTEVPATATATATEAATPKGQDYFSQVSSGEGGAGAVPTTSEDVSGVSNSGVGTSTPGTGTGAGSNAGSGASGNGLATPGTAGGGFMGKLRGLGRTTKRAHGESTPGTPAATPRASGSATPGAGTASSAAATASSNTPALQEAPPKPRTAAQVVLASGALNPPTEGPYILLSPDIPLLIAEERAPGRAIMYRGTIASAGTTGDVATLEDAMPVWLLEYLLLGRAQPVASVKLWFALAPVPNGGSGEEGASASMKLSATRFLRIRKLAAHVQERTEKLSSLNLNPRSTATSPRESPRSSVSIDTHNQNRPQPTTSHFPNAPSNPHSEQQVVGHSPRSRPEDLWEFLCNETVLPPDMTLAAVRQYIWRQSGELVLHYRRIGKRAAAMTHGQGEDHRTLAPRTAASSAGPS